MDRNKYFLDGFTDASDRSRPPPPPFDFPADLLHILTHVVRSEGHVTPPRRVKSFLSTDHVLSPYTHFPLKCVRGPCRGLNADTAVAYLAHYRRLPYKAPRHLQRPLRTSQVDVVVWEIENTYQLGTATAA